MVTAYLLWGTNKKACEKIPSAFPPTMLSRLLVHFLNFQILYRPMREQTYYSTDRRSRENVGRDVTFLHAHWSIRNSNVEEVDKQPEKHGMTDKVIII